MPVSSGTALSVREAVRQRRSCRAFTDQLVTEDMVRSLLDEARRAPSGGNVQPWRIIALAGQEKDAATALAQRVLFADPKGEDASRPIYPPDLPSPWRDRRFEVGEDLYRSMNIPREDKPARYAWVAQNFAWFGAPVGLFFITQKGFGHGQWAHMGMLMQTIALLAEERGLGTCMQEAWAKVRISLHDHLELAPDELLYCGMALGWPARDAPVNNWTSRRAPLDEIAEFRGFAASW